MQFRDALPSSAALAVEPPHEPELTDGDACELEWWRGGQNMKRKSRRVQIVEADTVATTCGLMVLAAEARDLQPQFEAVMLQIVALAKQHGVATSVEG